MGTHYTEDRGYTAAAYFDLVKQGVLTEDDRVELLEGVIVAEPPMDPPHAAGVDLVAAELRRSLGDRAWVREQKPLVVGARSVPEPDVAVIPGGPMDYTGRHPTMAFLVVEVSQSSLKQDRLSKARIYAAAAIPEYWILNLQDDCIEVYRAPDAVHAVYGDRRVARRGERIALVAFADVSVAVSAMLPWPPPPRDDV
jgi:Uma2 family endonuclease